MNDRTAEILAEALAIKRAIEEGAVPLSRIALRARGLAQLIDDDEAFMWLRLECEGALDPTKPTRKWKDSAAGAKGLGKFLKLRAATDYSSVKIDQLVSTIRTGKAPERTRALGAPLAMLEIEKGGRTKEEEVELAREPGGLDALTMLKLMDHEKHGAIERVAVAIHEWASHIYVAHRLRQAASSIFDRFKSATDAVLARLCPEAIGKLSHAVDRAASEDPEDWSEAALACRRVLKAFADAAYPPRTETVAGRSVGEAEYKNRLWAFAKDSGRQELEGQFLAEEEIEGLCKALDKVYDLSSKGIHAEVTRAEAEMAVLRTYTLLAQLAQLVRSTPATV